MHSSKYKNLHECPSGLLTYDLLKGLSNLETTILFELKRKISNKVLSSSLSFFRFSNFNSIRIFHSHVVQIKKETATEWNRKTAIICQSCAFVIILIHLVKEE